MTLAFPSMASAFAFQAVVTVWSVVAVFHMVLACIAVVVARVTEILSPSLCLAFRMMGVALSTGFAFFFAFMTTSSSLEAQPANVADPFGSVLVLRLQR